MRKSELVRGPRAEFETDVPAAVYARWNPLLAAEDDETSISILDVIGEGFFTEGVTSRRVDAALRRIGRGRDVTVNINSPGGDMAEGIAIYNLLREHKGSVRVRVLGIAASSASLIAMAGDDIVMNRASMMFIHNPWFVTMGDFQIFERAAAELKKWTDQGVAIYRARTDDQSDGWDEEQIRKAMNAESWLTAEESVRAGLADSAEDIVTTESAVAAANGLTNRAAVAAMNSALKREGLTRSERAALLRSLNTAVPVTGSEDAVPVTGPDFSALSAEMRKLEHTIKG